jgi:hypothetical protein
MERWCGALAKLLVLALLLVAGGEEPLHLSQNTSMQSLQHF